MSLMKSCMLCNVMGATDSGKGSRESLSSRKSNESVGLAPIRRILSEDAVRRLLIVSS